jgi:hypothetical protein
MFARFLAILGKDRDGSENDGQDGKQQKFAQDIPPTEYGQSMGQNPFGMMKAEKDNPHPCNVLRHPAVALGRKIVGSVEQFSFVNTILTQSKQIWAPERGGLKQDDVCYFSTFTASRSGRGKALALAMEQEESKIYVELTLPALAKTAWSSRETAASPRSP